MSAEMGREVVLVATSIREQREEAVPRVMLRLRLQNFI